MAFETLLKFAQSAGISLRENEPLCDHTTFRIGGPARWFAQPETVEQMIDLLAFVKAHHLSCAVVGKGSNLLVPDDGYNGLVIRTAEGVPCWHEDGCTVTVPSGYAMTRLSAEAAKRGLCGLTFAQGIPGTVGGAVVMNAGAYGGQIADTLVSSRCHSFSSSDETPNRCNRSSRTSSSVYSAAACPTGGSAAAVRSLTWTI